MLRQPLSLYEHGKSQSLLKAKVRYKIIKQKHKHSRKLLQHLNRYSVVTYRILIFFQRMIDAEACVVDIKGNQFICKLYVQEFFNVIVCTYFMYSLLLTTQQTKWRRDSHSKETKTSCKNWQCCYVHGNIQQESAIKYCT